MFIIYLFIYFFFFFALALTSRLAFKKAYSHPLALYRYTTTFYTVQTYCLHCHCFLIISKYFGNFRYLPVTLGRCGWYVASFEWGELTCSQSLERSVQGPAFPFTGRFLNWPRNSGTNVLNLIPA